MPDTKPTSVGFFCLLLPRINRPVIIIANNYQGMLMTDIVTPQELAEAVKANVDGQIKTAAALITKLVHEKLAERIRALKVGTQTDDPTTFRVTIPPAYYRSKTDKAGAEAALVELQRAGFNVTPDSSPNAYDEDTFFFEFKA